MNKELLQKWLEALRGGQYPQTSGWLRDSMGCCCLGVLADVSGLGKWEPSDDAEVHMQWTLTSGWSCETYLPDWLLEQVGLTTDQAEELVRLNDAGANFKEIAAKIERLVLNQ